MVVQGHILLELLLQIFTIGEPMSFKHIGDVPIETLHHAVGLGRGWFAAAEGRGMRNKSFLGPSLCRLCLHSRQNAMPSCSSLRTVRHLRLDSGHGACVFVQGNHQNKAPWWAAGGSKDCLSTAARLCSHEQRIPV